METSKKSKPRNQQEQKSGRSLDDRGREDQGHYNDEEEKKERPGNTSVEGGKDYAARDSDYYNAQEYGERRGRRSSNDRESPRDNESQQGYRGR